MVFHDDQQVLNFQNVSLSNATTAILHKKIENVKFSFFCTQNFDGLFDYNAYVVICSLCSNSDFSYYQINRLIQEKYGNCPSFLLFFQHISCHIYGAVLVFSLFKLNLIGQLLLLRFSYSFLIVLKLFQAGFSWQNFDNNVFDFLQQLVIMLYQMFAKQIQFLI